MNYQKRILQGIIDKLINSERIVVIDTETTGLTYADEIIEIAVLSTAGDVLLHSLVKPSRPIPAASTEIHHITDEMVANAPTWAEVYPRLMEVLGDKRWIGWKSEFDARLITQTCLINGLYDNLPPALLLAEYERIHGSQIDAKRIYSEWYGEPYREKGGFVRQRLAAATRQMGVIHDNAHQAIADCYAVIDVLQRASRWVDSEDLVLAQLLDSLPNVASFESLAGQQLLVSLGEVAQSLTDENKRLSSSGITLSTVLANARAEGVELFSSKFAGTTQLSSMVKEVATDFANKLRAGLQ